jgi:hypothetical protein
VVNVVQRRRYNGGYDPDTAVAMNSPSLRDRAELGLQQTLGPFFTDDGLRSVDVVLGTAVPFFLNSDGGERCHPNGFAKASIYLRVRACRKDRPLPVDERRESQLSKKLDTEHYGSVFWSRAA